MSAVVIHLDWQPVKRRPKLRRGPRDGARTSRAGKDGCKGEVQMEEKGRGVGKRAHCSGGGRQDLSNSCGTHGARGEQLGEAAPKMCVGRAKLWRWRRELAVARRRRQRVRGDGGADFSIWSR
uniref:Uncharacterized protein n=1 Tax=Leersia perrieri TaxID=77586 RepID=A0A0D9VWY0_9ORYZ